MTGRGVEMKARSGRTRMPSVLAAVAVAVLITAACGEESSPPATGGGGDTGEKDYGEVKIVLSGSSLEDKVPQVGAYRFGPEFGFSQQSIDDYQAIDSHATAAQIFLSGRADIMEGTFVVVPQLIQEGQDVKAFCPEEVDTLEHLAGVGISDLQDITDPGIRVGVDSPGGLINYLMNHVFRAQGITNDQGEPLTVDDLENVKVLEDGGLRLAALVSNEIDVGSLDLFEAAELRKQVGAQGDFNVLSVTANDIDKAVGSVFLAKTEWLEEDPERAAAFCASILKGTRTAGADFDTYLEWAKETTKLEVDEEVQRAVWKFSRSKNVWPYDADPFEEDVVAEDIDVLIDSGLLEAAAADLAYEDLIYRDAVDRAVEMLGGPIGNYKELEG
jgi:hypothetical protein